MPAGAGVYGTGTDGTLEVVLPLMSWEPAWGGPCGGGSLHKPAGSGEDVADEGGSLSPALRLSDADYNDLDVDGLLRVTGLL